jgi:excinuclease ABC subunit C
VKEIMDDLGVEDVPFVGVAKGIDRDPARKSSPPRPRPFALRPQRPGALFRPAPARRGAPLRHRRAPREAGQGGSATPLDEVPGVGAARKRALLAHFGSAKAVGRAGLADLRAVEGISEALARRIHDHFHPG